MDITSLTVALSVVVIIAAAVLTASNQPPLWVCLLAGLGSWPLSTVLLGTPTLASAVGNGTVSAWAVRFTVAATLTTASSFFGGGGNGGGRDDYRPTDGPASVRRQSGTGTRARSVR
ncbi:hypothetical protein [Streptomyces sp. NPDC002588]|uniref:hypothetical protein n=1 Tax=Streptomyces sp. NPDC002588 TaxID=3154419 RepID=UPI00332966CE